MSRPAQKVCKPLLYPIDHDKQTIFDSPGRLPHPAVLAVDSSVAAPASTGLTASRTVHCRRSRLESLYSTFRRHHRPIRIFRRRRWQTIPFRHDRLSGPAWEEVMLAQYAKEPGSFIGERDHIAYRMTYRSAGDHLVVECSMTNLSDKPFCPKRSRLILGIDSEMHSYPQWDNKFFPTLLRCEKDFAWGYFMSPRQVLFGFATSQPVASYALNYIYEGWYKWKWGHQIRTASLELLHTLPLPERHPQHLTQLAPGETRSWEIHLGRIDSLDHVKSQLSAWADIPLIECNRYTLLPDEPLDIRVNSTSPITLSIEGPDAKHIGTANPIDWKRTLPSLIRSRPAGRIPHCGNQRVGPTGRSPRIRAATLVVVHEERPRFRSPQSTYLFQRLRDFLRILHRIPHCQIFPRPGERPSPATTLRPHPAPHHRYHDLDSQPRRPAPPHTELLGLDGHAGRSVGGHRFRPYLEKAAHIADYLCSDALSQSRVPTGPTAHKAPTTQPLSIRPSRCSSWPMPNKNWPTNRCGTSDIPDIQSRHNGLSTTFAPVATISRPRAT